MFVQKNVCISELAEIVQIADNVLFPIKPEKKPKQKGNTENLCSRKHP